MSVWIPHRPAVNNLSVTECVIHLTSHTKANRRRAYRDRATTIEFRIKILVYILNIKIKGIFVYKVGYIITIPGPAHSRWHFFLSRPNHVIRSDFVSHPAGFPWPAGFPKKCQPLLLMYLSLNHSFKRFIQKCWFILLTKHVFMSHWIIHSNHFFIIVILKIGVLNILHFKYIKMFNNSFKLIKHF